MRPALRFVFATTALITPELPAAQDERVMRLVAAVWDHGADTALARYDAFPPSNRSAVLLVAAADNLLWMGRHCEAAAFLARAAALEPFRAEVRFQQGRAALQRAELDSALSAFREGLRVVPQDTSLTDEARGSLRRRFENRIGLLTQAHDLGPRSGAYRSADGRLFLFKFDPYINTFPALLEPSTGELRILYPAETGGLEWRDGNGRAAGTVRFEGAGANEGVLVMRGNAGELRATGLGLRQERIGVQSAGASIDGTLFLPPGDGPFPAIVLSHGAGLSSRYNLVLEAAAYATAGIAAYVYDKPGLGRSLGGNWLLLSIRDQASYALDAARHLASRADIGAIGMWGFSQGGWVAPMAAARDSTIAFVVIVSGAAVSPQEQNNQSVARRLKEAGVPEAQVEEAVAHLRAVWDRVNRGAAVADLADLYSRAADAPWGKQVQRLTFDFESVWWRQNEVDASVALRALRVPVLALLGEHDAAVPPEDNVPLFARHLAAAPTGDYTITVLSGANHQVMRGDHYHALYFPTMVSWVASRFRHPSGRLSP